MTQAPRAEAKNRITLRFLAEPTDVNFSGKAHGGTVMKWIDQAGYVCASGWSGRYCVTAYVGGIRFRQPIQIGHLIDVQARLIHTGTTSMHVAVDVWSAPPTGGKSVHTTHCVIIFVAVDDDGKPVMVPPWQPQNEEDMGLQRYAVRLMELRKSIDEEMKPFFEH